MSCLLKKIEEPMSPNLNMKRYISLILFIGIFAGSGYGQTFNAFMKASETAYAKKEYYAAYTYLQEAYKFDTTRLDVLYSSANMARLYNAFGKAENQFQTVIDRDGDDSFPEASFYLGAMEQLQGKYEEAIQSYNLYLSEQEDEDEYLTAKAKKEIKSSEYSLSQINNPDLSVTVTRLDSINTQFSEVGAIEKDGKLYYSSLRFPHPEPEDARNPKYLAKILVSEDGADGDPLDGVNNDLLITSYTAFSNMSNRLYYSLCDYNESNDIKCDLYFREIRGENRYGDAVKLPDHINDEVFSTTHPAVGYDAETNKEILYFTSNRPGGKGKYDIWYSVIDDNMNMTQPMNLDSINTSSNEVTPFFHSPSNTLYFSSQGYQGLGGYDVYRAEKLNTNFNHPELLENPVNSSYDDMFYTLSNDMLKGHLSSNREGASFIEDEISACCFDIYEAIYEPVNIDLDALTCEDIEGNQRPLLGATVCLVDAKTNMLLDSITNYDADLHHFELERNKEYLIIAKKQYFQPDTVKLSTYKIYKSKTFTKKICLLPKTICLNVFTFDELTKSDLSGVTVTITDLTDNTVSVITRTNAGGNDFNFDAKEGHAYKLSASRENYSTDVQEVNTLTAEVKDGCINQDMFLNFGPMYLPISLYFDNDKVDSRTTRRTTKTIYGDSFDRYYAKKAEFEANAPNPALIAEFFESEVKGGHDTLQIFMAGMELALESGRRLEITIRGFTSPRSTNSYNLYLGQRRVASVRNELLQYEDGLFEEYLDSEQLTITDISYGETLAPKDISDSIKDKEESIYSFSASKERRVEILEVNQIK